MTKEQLEVLQKAATAIVNRFGAVRVENLTNKIHPQLKGVRKTSIVKELKEMRDDNFYIEDDILKISYFASGYDRSPSILESSKEYKEWTTIAWEDIEEYADARTLPFTKEAEELFSYCCSKKQSLKEHRDVFSFRLANYANTHDYFSNCTIIKYILEPFGLNPLDDRLKELLKETLNSQPSWLKNGRSEKDRIKEIWKEENRESVKVLTEKEYKKLSETTVSVAEFYGIISLRNYYKLLKRYNKKLKLDKDQLRQYLSTFREESGLFFFDDFIISSKIYDWNFSCWKMETLKMIDPDGYIEYRKRERNYNKIVALDTNIILHYAITSLIRLQKDKPFFIPTEEELLKYSDLNYLKKTQSLMELEDLYIKNNCKYSNDMKKFEGIFRKYANMPGDNVGIILGQFFEESGFTKINDGTKIKEILRLTRIALNTLPRWINNGFSVNEMGTFKKN